MWARWYGPIVERFRGWAAAEPSVRAAMIVGSQARTIEPADEWSDLDVVIFHTSPEKLTSSPDWVGQFGTVVLTFVEPAAVLQSRERRVLYADGKDVDFAVFPSSALGTFAHSAEAGAVLARGCEVLVDKDLQLATLEDAVTQQPPGQSRSPSEEQFQAAVADFWYHVLWAAKKLRRGELWTAKLAIDCYLKRLLIEMIEWQASVRHGKEVDVWHSGRFFDRWSDPDVRARIPATFSRYELGDLTRGLNETSQVFSEIAHEVARGHRWNHPDEAETAVRRLTELTLRENTTNQ
jgi:aminoglycoside 6-adenylyltransferase